MKWMYFVGALFVAACSQPQQTVAADRAEQPTQKAGSRGSVSPSAPVKLTYRVNENETAGQPLTIDIAINTRLASGILLVEVAKQEGAALIGAATQRIDLANVARPITLQMHAVPGTQTERFLVLLLTVDTEMGQMSRSFRVDLAPAAETDTAP